MTERPARAPGEHATGPALGTNPFLHYRSRLGSYRRAVDEGLGDTWFVEVVSTLDAAVERVDGQGFGVTPVVDGDRLAAGAGLDVELVIKDETGNVAGSHKARHLFGVALHLLVDEAMGRAISGPLAIASCGNAALAAAVVARAMDRPLEVYVPTWADAGVVAHMHDLGAAVTHCDRRTGGAGDPAYLRFREAVADGATPFSVQGTDTPTAFDGGRTLAWELVDQAPGLASIYVQVGGGALATSVAQAMPGVRLHPVQAAGCAPLRAAWDRLAPGFDLAAAAAHPDRYMRPWPAPSSIATGILDDITYDWLPLLEATRASHGHPVVASEDLVARAHELARAHTSVPVSATGTAGFAGLLAEPPAAQERVAVLFTGCDRATT